MLENLVVIASHGQDHIRDCLDSLGDKYEILVVTSPGEKIRSYGHVRAVELPFQGYTTGKYLWAYWNYPAKNFFFMQDSMQALQKDYLAPFIKQQPTRGAVAWAKFPLMFDDPHQIQWATYCYGENLPTHGIFGPIFYTNRQSLDELRDKQLLPPTPMNKPQAQGTERLWAMAFHNAGMPVLGPHWGFDTEAMETGTWGTFTKTWVDRK